MSLLDRNAPHKVWVQNRHTVRDDRGARAQVPDGPRVLVKCLHEPARDWSSAEENQGGGLQVVDLRIIRSRKWPGDVNSLVYIDGGEYETVGTPQPLKVGRRTRHWRVTTRWVRDDPNPALNVDPAPTSPDPQAVPPTGGP